MRLQINPPSQGIVIRRISFIRTVSAHKCSGREDDHSRKNSNKAINNTARICTTAVDLRHRKQENNVQKKVFLTKRKFFSPYAGSDDAWDKGNDGCHWDVIMVNHHEYSML
jgi:hypothetical protein